MACSVSSRIGPRQTSPWRESWTSVSSNATPRGCGRSPPRHGFEHRVQQLRSVPRRRRMTGHQRVPADQNAIHQIRAASTGVPRRGIAIGLPGSAGRDVGGQRLRRRDAGLDERPAAGDVGRPPQPARLPGVVATASGAACSRYCVWRPDLLGVAVHRRRARRRTRWRCRSGRCARGSTGLRAHRRARRRVKSEAGQHLGALAGEAGVDQQHPVAVDHHRPVDQVGPRDAPRR